MRKKRVLSVILSLTMLAGMVPSAVFAEETPVGSAYFDFDASEYVSNEADGTLEVKVCRQGSAEGEVSVAIKAADFLSTYGEDYELLVDGEPMTPAEGTTVDPSQFVWEEGGRAEPAAFIEEDSGLSEEENEAAADAVSGSSEDTDEDASEEASELSEDTDITASEEFSDAPESTEKTTAEETGGLLENTGKTSADESSERPVSTAKASVSTGSNLRDAQAAYLKLPENPDTDTEKAGDAASEMLNEMYSFFKESQGAEGVLHFEDGETYKSITVRILDNEAPDGEKMFLLGLMATDSENAVIAPNATTYVTISDDEEKESAAYSLEANRTVLTKENPTAEVTVRRLSGLQYFSSAYLSTVTETAEKESYENFSLKPAAFAPGQETVTVPVTALDFTGGGSFGIRLETEDGDTAEDYFLSFTIEREAGAAKKSAKAALVQSEDDGSNGGNKDSKDSNEDSGKSRCFGEPTVSYGKGYNSFDTLGGGFKAAEEVEWISENKKNYASTCNGEKLSISISNPAEITFTTNNSIDMAGVKNISFSWGISKENSFDDSGFEGSVVVETLNPDSVGGGYDSTATYSYVSYYNDDEKNYGYIKETTNNLPGVNTLWADEGWGGDNWWRCKGYHLFSFSLNNRGILGSGIEKTDTAWIDNLKFEYAKYSFDLRESPKDMPGYLYDFTDLRGDAPNMVNIFRWLGTDEDGNPIYSEDNMYTPPALTIKTEAGQNIEDFYLNGEGADLAAVLEPEEPLPPGLYLKRAYFCTDDPYDAESDSFSTTDLYVDASDDGKIHLTLNREFIRDLMKKSGIDKTDDTVIRVYPVYGEDDVTVRFDNLGHEANAAGSYADGDWNAEIKNLKVCGLKTDNNDCYVYEVPAGSVLRLNMTPAAERTAAGFRYRTKDSGDTVWLKEGDTVASGSDPNETVLVTDYTTAEILVTEDTNIVPVTGAQGLYVGYFPAAEGEELIRPDLEIIGEDGKVTTTSDYTNAVVDYSNGVPDKDSVVGTDANGSMTMEGVRTGDEVVLRASPPDAYYTYWTDMTGDTNNDGVIDEQEAEEAGTRRRDGEERSDNPLYVYGDVLSLKLDQDNTRYYYEFEPGEQNGKNVTGKVVRESSSLYDLVNRTPKKTGVPVAGAYVNIVGSVGQTDGSGKYQVTLKGGLPKSGSVSGFITENNSIYNLMISLERFNTFVLPALEQFDARSISASYSGKSVKGQSVTVEDGALTVTAQIDYYGAVVPTKAHFSIVHSDGTVKLECDGRDNYTTTVKDLGSRYLGGAGNTFEASLTFNPLQDIANGDKLCVSFEDQSGHIYTPIDTGYIFFPKLSLKDVVLSALGPDITEVYKSGFVEDLVGDPLASMEMGKIGNLSADSEDYTPAGIPVDEKSKYVWQKSTFDWNYSTKFTPDLSKKGGVEEAGKKVATTDEAELKKGTTTMPKDSKSAGPSQSGGGFSNKGSFSFSITPTVGFRLSVTQRPQKDGSIKAYFEDLVLYAKCDADLSGKMVIQTPIGISVVITANLTGNKTNNNPIITGIYRMYVDYQGDKYEGKYAVPYDENFRFFKAGNDGLRHEGYIFLDPEITLGLSLDAGVASIYGQASFAFDMDFHFTEKDTETYGKLDISGQWGVKLLTFDVYSKSLGSTDVKLFNSKGVNAPFGFSDLKNTNALPSGAGQTLSDAVNDVMSVENEALSPTVSDRGYLENRSEWNGSAGRLMTSRGNEEGTAEAVLQTGTSHNQKFRIVPFGTKGRALAVFVDDDPDRSGINARAVYYSVRGTDGSWSEPQIIDDDGTLDDYPYAEDLDDGRILIAWSSSDRVLKDEASLEEALQSLSIEYAVFDTSKETMGQGKVLTHATDQDISGDLMPCIAFDRNAEKAILYYTKTEYKDLQELNDIGEAYSAIAYLLYDPETGGWSNTGDSYTDEELSGMTDAEKTAYKENWYGQRFLDLRLNPSADRAPLVVESEAIDYNGLGLFAYIVDWDEDQNTVNDRDVFLQTYDFSTGEFPHIIRISPETGCYGDPELEDSDNTCYLFYGAEDPETGEGTIRMLNIGYYLTKDCKAEVTNGTNRYHVLQSPDGSPIEAGVAAVCGHIQDYTTVVTDEGRICLLWDDVPDSESGRDIHAAIYNNTDGEDRSGEPHSLWSEPVVITESDKDTFYNGFGAFVSDGAIVILSSKGSFSDSNFHGIVQIVHKPFARIELDKNLAMSDTYPAEGEVVSVSAMLKNIGLKQDHDGETVTFYVNGKEAGVASYNKYIPGGSSARVTTTIRVPAGECRITAKCNNTEAECEPERGVRLSAENETFDYVNDMNNVPTYERVYRAVLHNDGNEPTGTMKLTAKAGDKVLAETTAPEIAAKGFSEVELAIPFDETLYALDETTGVASLDIGITVSAGGEELHSTTEKLTRQYDAEAIAALKTCQGVSGLDFSMNVDDFELLVPTVRGEGLTVDWLRTSDPGVVWLDYNGEAYAAGVGTARLTGIIVPETNVHELHSDGSFRQKDWSELVPASLLHTVTATVTVRPAGTPYGPSTTATGSIKDKNGNSVDVAVTASIPRDRTEYTGKSITPESLGATVELSMLTEAAALFLTKDGADPSKLFAVSWKSAKNKNAGTAKYYAVIKFNESQAKKWGMKAKELKRMKKLLAGLNKKLKAGKLKVTVSPLNLETTAVRAKGSFDKKGRLKLKWVKAETGGKSRKLKKKYYKIVGKDPSVNTVTIRGKKNYTGEKTVTLE